jgi:hypothetical protein
VSSPDNNERVHWLYRPENRPKLWWGLWIILATTVIAQIFVHVHAYFSVDGWFGFSAVYGFLACAGMVIFAKVLGSWLKRPEDYYDND